MTKHYLEQLTNHYPELQSCIDDVEKAYETIKESYENNGKLLIAGNGGSAADCEHIVGELMKGFVSSRKLPDEEIERLNKAGDDGSIGQHLQGALPAISLVSHSALMTAFSNDVAPELVFAQQVYGYGNENDIFLGISTSGNSKNIIQAAIVAKAKGLKTICLTGKTGGRLNDICDVTIRVPYEETYRIQERHLPVYHTLCLMLEEEFFG
ncbi:SIS domain-containing protein [Bacillus sp. JJ1533]|uniref:D-sedoheptulose-7-phosphate isomerase n=1 Tax=Bacillus sp. JJ1533 TaxID=3122959 RepID=UPI003000D1FE